MWNWAQRVWLSSEGCLRLLVLYILLGALGKKMEGDAQGIQFKVEWIISRWVIEKT